MNLLVTGSSGFVGQYFLKNLISSYCVKTFSLQKDKLDALDLQGVDAVVHLAALVHQMNGASWSEYKKANVDYPVSLAKKAKKSGVKQFVFMSSTKVYGEESIVPFTEDSVCEPKDDYGKSKLLAEKELLKLSDNSFIVTIIRTPVVYGEGVKGNIIKLLQLVDKMPILPFGCIKNRRSMVYVGNLCALIEKVLEKKVGGIFLASDSKSFSTTRLIELVASALKKREINLCMPLIGFLLNKLNPNLYIRLYGNFEIDATLTKKRLGFKEPFSTEDGILNMVKWYNG